MKKMKPNACAFLTLSMICLILPCLSGGAEKQAGKPRLIVAADGLPAGHETPEGAACDLARAFINRDADLFSSASIRLYGGGGGRKEYATFLELTVRSIRAEA